MTKFRALFVSSLLAATLVGGAAATTSGAEAAGKGKAPKAPVSQRDIWCC
jgi:hypothetical protein